MSNEITCFDGPYFFLSNFYPSIVRYKGYDYKTVEHAYQAAKTKNEVLRNEIRLAATASRAKALGKKVPLRSNWDKLKLSVMRKLLYQKFEDPYLREQLLNTGDAILIEGNTWGDTYWGVCNGVGENHLGKLLMTVRSNIKGEDDGI